MPDGRVRDWEPEFIGMWRQGVPVEAIAEAHHIPLGTAKSRAHTLQKEGKITPRPRGHHMLARQERPTISVQPPATPAPPAVTFVAVPEVQEMLSVLKDLQARVMSLEQVREIPAVPAPPIAPAPPATPATPATPAPERRDVQQWTIRLSRALIEDVKALAYDRRLHPSEIVEELLKEALHNRRSE